MGSQDDIRKAVLRALETERLLGVRHAPLSFAAKRPTKPTGVSTQSTSRPATGGRTGVASHATPAARPAGTAVAASTGPLAANQPKVVRLDMLHDEVASRTGIMQRLNEGQVAKCKKCALCETRTRTVFGQGDVRTRLVFVGEAPGFDEDQQGLAFVGRAGQLLTKMIEAMGLNREWVFICNILKCRPPNNRDPAPDEISACWPYLDEQLRTIAPEVIVALGKPASQTLLRTGESIGRLRGQWHEYFTSGQPGVGEPTPLMPTYHPAYLLRNPPDKAKAWADLKQVMARLNLGTPA